MVRDILSYVIPAKAGIQARLIFVLALLLVHPVFAADVPDLEDQTRAISTELRCVVCQNLSVADSPSEMAQQMRAVVREQLQAGKSPQEIKDFFVSKYGGWVLLKPATEGFSLLVWVVPFVALIIGLGVGIFFIRRWAANKSSAQPAPVDPKWLARAREEFAAAEPVAPDLEDASPSAPLLQQRSRLYSDLKELEFDFQAGKISEGDYAELRRDLEVKAAAVLDALDRAAASIVREKATEKAGPTSKEIAAAREKTGLRGWQLAAGGVFLLIFGLVLGIALTNSLKPRTSQGDSITGDFLTGTNPAPAGEAAGQLQEGKAAFNKQEFPKAIEAFKKVLAVEPNQPEALAYMGFILMQAGHADGALMAFDKALATAPNFPMALWGKGMTLYQGKQDFAGARAVLEKLLPLVPPGEEKNEIVKVLAEIPAGGQRPPQSMKPSTAAAAAPAPSSGQVSGQISIDPKLKTSVDSQAVLFIIARPAAGGGGPPLAVKRIDRPSFPLAYSLGAENVMMQGTSFTGKINITVRLDKDGNAATRTAGDISGEYKKNPAEVGSKNVDIVLDQLAK